MNWKTKSEIHARLDWLKDLRLINYEDFSTNYSITDLGENFLEEVGFFKYEDLNVDTDSTVNEKTVPISSWAKDMLKLSEEVKAKKRNNIGYTLGSNQGVHNIVLGYLLMMSSPTELSTIVEYSSSTFDIADTLAKAFLYTLVNLDFVERRTKTIYQTSVLGQRSRREVLKWTLPVV